MTLWDLQPRVLEETDSAWPRDKRRIDAERAGQDVLSNFLNPTSVDVWDYKRNELQQVAG